MEFEGSLPQQKSSFEGTFVRSFYLVPIFAEPVKELGHFKSQVLKGVARPFILRDV